MMSERTARLVGVIGGGGVTALVYLTAFVLFAWRPWEPARKPDATEGMDFAVLAAGVCVSPFVVVAGAAVGSFLMRLVSRLLTPRRPT
jgi:hypothetical protein